MVVTLGNGSTTTVTGGADNSGIFARNYTDDPGTGDDVVSTGNINISVGVSSTITVGGAGTNNQEGIGAYTNATTGTATDITILADNNGTITVTGNDIAGINARQQATSGTGDVSVTINADNTINIVDTAAGGSSYGIRATNAGSGLVSVTSEGAITAAGLGTADITGISASGNAGVTVNMAGGSIGTAGNRVGIGIGAAANGTNGDVNVSALTSSERRRRARRRVHQRQHHVNVDGALNSVGGAGLRLTGGTTTRWTPGLVSGMSASRSTAAPPRSRPARTSTEACSTSTSPAARSCFKAPE